MNFNYHNFISIFDFAVFIKSVSAITFLTQFEIWWAFLTVLVFETKYVFSILSKKILHQNSNYNFNKIPLCEILWLKLVFWNPIELIKKGKICVIRWIIDGNVGYNLLELQWKKPLVEKLVSTVNEKPLELFELYFVSQENYSISLIKFEFVDGIQLKNAKEDFFHFVWKWILDGLGFKRALNLVLNFFFC